MTIQLDPFHLIRQVNCPEPAQKALKVGYVNNVTDINYEPDQQCADCSAAPGVQTYFRADIFCWLTAPILDCKSEDWTVFGRDSGYSISFDFTPKASLGVDCRDLKCQAFWCEVFPEPARMVLAYHLDASTNNAWSLGGFFGTNKFFRRCLSLRSDEAFGFIKDEFVDVSFTPADPVAISSIETHASGILVTTTIDHRMPTKAWVTLTGTGIYDGNYETNLVSTTSFWVAATYTVDVFLGFVKPKYDQIPAPPP